MKKVLITLLALLSMVSVETFAQQKKPNPMFASAKKIRQYLKENVSKIDPIEGEYYTKRYYNSGSPLDPADSTELTYFIVTDPKTGFLSLYCKDLDGFHESENVWFSYTDVDDVYKMYWHNSLDSIKLEQDNTIINAKISLSDEDAKAFANNPQWKPWITLTYFMRKTYPTPEMYSAAKKEE